MKFEEVKSDYIEIIRKHGFPEDMTGGFVDAGHMEVVIRNPTKLNAKKYMLSVIEYGFQLGKFWSTEDGKITIDECELVNRIYDKYIW